MLGINRSDVSNIQIFMMSKTMFVISKTFRRFDLFEHPAVVQAYTAGTVLAKGKLNSISYIKHDISILLSNTSLCMGGFCSRKNIVFLIKEEIHQQNYVNPQTSNFGDENIEITIYPIAHI